ncbi:MAG: mannose-1-phosphate guanylyltransferase, partial [Aestuariivirga sp.]
IVACNVAHEMLVRQQAADAFPGKLSLLLEPESRGTAPALCAAALLAERLTGPDTALLALPADHIISGDPAFSEAIDSAAELANAEYLVTFAIKPNQAVTGFGYLKLGETLDPAKRQFKVEAFIEKPDAERAKQFLAGGGYAWNSGIFMFKAGILIEAFERFQPEILAACREALPKSALKPSVRLDRQAFAAAPSTSIDYAIMEKADNIAAVIGDFAWSDVGDWNSVWLEAKKDDKGAAPRGNVLAIDCTGSLIRSDGPMLVGVGLEDMIVVATKHAILVAPRSRAQDVSQAVDQLAARGRSIANEDDSEISL